MPIVNATLPTIGDPNATEDVDVRNTLQSLLNTVNGGLDKDNISDGGVTTTEIADANVTKVKLATDALNNFLKLAVAGDVKVKFGVAASGGFAGGNMITGAIAHGLGKDPTIALIVAGDIAAFGGAGGVQPIVVSVASHDAVNINWRARIADGQNSNNGVNLYWLVIG